MPAASTVSCWPFDCTGGASRSAPQLAADCSCPAATSPASLLFLGSAAGGALAVACSFFLG